MRAVSVILIGPIAFLLAGCAFDVSKYKIELSRSIEDRDGERVDVVFQDATYFLAEPLEWARERKLSAGEAVFAKGGTSNACYILGPDNALETKAGSHFRGEVSSALVYEWPVEVFIVYQGCLPVKGEVISSPMNIRVSPPRDIRRYPVGSDG